ncbi:MULTISPECIES: AbrB/MazE/SpoVT family DNA-binding domain-containing protein [unclassified Microbacterium]|uniref:AbrB/MazE/SpoVT family DNA-binding domain-containing protein n=1 Tax=unclassified Microbacterium TaxID=2609290 RepID=UPI0006F56DE7|nr:MULTISPECIES: AbrB/MazE/SpoVT family DNA-binding domain-containing protein [unclassified Microbacterium]KQQ66746.1 AbrB family transcriptional regulator [Microbacterium sp. Leaf320]KQR39662.1 AbrB family transcriptional regulator [Microbacterium sp. Leaf159]
MSTAEFHGYVGVQSRGLIALPASVRERLRLNEPGTQLEVTERADGVVELRAAVPVPAEQAWFWTERWQQREREVDAHVAAGRVSTFDSGEAFLESLEALESEQ